MLTNRRNSVSPKPYHPKDKQGARHIATNRLHGVYNFNVRLLYLKKQIEKATATAVAFMLSLILST